MGQVFGLHLHEAGVELAYYAHPETAEQLKQAREVGLPIRRITNRNRDTAVRRLRGYQVLTDTADSRAFGPDQIWFITPKFRRTEFLPEGIGEDRMVFGISS